MARLVLTLDLPSATAATDDPHDAVEELFAYARYLPTFQPGLKWSLGGDAPDDAIIYAGTFVSAEWSG